MLRFVYSDEVYSQLEKVREYALCKENWCDIEVDGRPKDFWKNVAEFPALSLSDEGLMVSHILRVIYSIDVSPSNLSARPFHHLAVSIRESGEDWEPAHISVLLHFADKLKLPGVIFASTLEADKAMHYIADLKE